METARVLAAALLVTALLVVATPAEAKPGEPVCPQVYFEIPLGPVTIVRSGCDTDVRFNGLSPCDWDPAWC